MMIHPKTFREEFEHATLEELIKERDVLIREIRRYETGKIPLDELLTFPSLDTVYHCNNLYLPELCYLINEKSKEEVE